MDIETVSDHASKFIQDTHRYVTETGNSLSPDLNLEQYINCIWLLSFCYFFDAPKEDVRIIAEHIPFTGDDSLVDRLIAASDRGYPLTLENSYVFPEVSEPLMSALPMTLTREERDAHIFRFLDNYYPTLGRHHVTWHDSHKETDPEYCIYTGYWVFELAALVADAGIDDSAFRDHPFYPKDLVDWKRARLREEEQRRVDARRLDDSS